MGNIFNILEGIEKLAYKFLLSVIFIPKTIIQITINPSWVPGYVTGELKQEKSPFDEYLSPVILLLIVALIPAMIINFLPTFGADITGVPVEGEPANTRLIKFEAETKLISGSLNTSRQYSWYVEKITGSDDKGNTLYEEIYRETYNEYTHKTIIEEAGSPPVALDGMQDITLEYPNQNYNTSRSDFYYQFKDNSKENTEDDYYINFEVTVFDPNEMKDKEGNNFALSSDSIFDPRENNERVLETYYDYRVVAVPASNDPNQQIAILDVSNKPNSKPSTANISDLLKKETTILLALGLLFPPLLFALAAKLFRGEEISENMLRGSFYAQCYYFSPLSLAIWATYYAGNFFTPDVYYYKGDAIAAQAILLPSLLAVIWFIGIETQAIAQERQTSVWKSFLIVIGCIAILGLAGMFIYLFIQPYSSVPDTLRTWAILAYPLTAIVLVAAFGFIWFKQRRAEGQKFTSPNIVMIVVILLIIFGVMEFISWSLKPTANAPVDITAPSPEVTAEAPSSGLQGTQATEPPTQVPATDTRAPESQQFYTEEFDGNLDSWSSFMSSGIESQVNMGIQSGSLVFKLSPYEDKIPWVVLINNAFTYTNVKVEAVTTNHGNNANGVSVICQYSDKGWYEFTLSNGGKYAIFAFDAVGNVQQGYNLLSNGGSTEIKTGQVTNVYTAICEGSQLTLYANHVQVQSITDTSFNFAEGKIGIGASSPQTLPVDVQFDSVTVSQP